MKNIVLALIIFIAGISLGFYLNSKELISDPPLTTQSSIIPKSNTEEPNNGDITEGFLDAAMPKYEGVGIYSECVTAIILGGPQSGTRPPCKENITQFHSFAPNPDIVSQKPFDPRVPYDLKTSPFDINEFRDHRSKMGLIKWNKDNRDLKVAFNLSYRNKGVARSEIFPAIAPITRWTTQKIKKDTGYNLIIENTDYINNWNAEEYFSKYDLIIFEEFGKGVLEPIITRFLSAAPSYRFDKEVIEDVPGTNIYSEGYYLLDKNNEIISTACTITLMDGAQRYTDDEKVGFRNTLLNNCMYKAMGLPHIQSNSKHADQYLEILYQDNIKAGMGKSKFIESFKRKE